MTHFEIVAHRGAREEAPENTLPAFQRAAAKQEKPNTRIKAASWAPLSESIF